MSPSPPLHYVTFSASTLCHLLRLHPPFQRHISLAKWLHRLVNPHSHVLVCIANTRVYMRTSSGRFSTCFVVSAHSHVCVYPRVFTYSKLFILCYSYGTFFCKLPNVFRCLCPLTCVCVFVRLNPHVVTSSRHLDLSYNTFCSHTSVFTPTPTSAYVFTVTYCDMPPKKKVPIGRVSSATTKIALLRATATPQETVARLAYQRDQAAASRASETPHKTRGRVTNIVHRFLRLVIPGNTGYHT
jgi:hypothetical protein